MQLNATASGTDTNGLIRLEGIIGMPADLTMTADADASIYSILISRINKIKSEIILWLMKRLLKKNCSLLRVISK